ncbi:MAG: signal peptide peptidase SppA [Acidobacteria bacterium]|nr:MAG: signal peptide peptidase SppA [Acidobacteriota bacterium]PYR08796.1 MAG: signal peptide peptidase SppA [Acidobacteriota bacterium]
MARRGFAILFTLLGIAFFVSIVGFAILYFMFGREPAVPSNATLVLRVGGDLSEVVPADVVGYLRGVRTPTVRSVVDNLRKAKADGRVRAVMLKPTGFESPFWGKVQEIRDAVIEFKKSGKPVYAYLEYGGDREYYLATAADKIYLMPASPLNLTGVATYELFLRGTLDKIGAYPDLHHIGDYKTAVNTFTEKGYTPAHKEMDQSLNRDLYEQIVRGIADGRKKNEADVQQLFDDGPFLPEDALRAGLIDDVAYEDQVDEKLRAGEQRRQIDSDDYTRISLSSVGLNRGPRIAVIYAAGAITGGRSGFDPLNGAVVGSDTLIEYIRQARRDSSVRAIVLRIDSPGGSATASDAIWRELTIAKNERADRPLVASMSDLAASGGYYIAMPAQVIVAQPSTLTGSIGIFGGKIVTGGVYDKLGARIESTSIGRNAEINSPARPFNPEELKKLQEQLQAFYDQFVEKAADSRHSTPEQIDALAQGRVWTGRQAKQNHLVDELGGLDRAIAIAKQRAKIPSENDVELVIYPPRKSFYELVSDQFSGSSESATVGAWLNANLSRGELEVLRTMRGPLALFRRGEPLALMPFTFVR